MNEWTLEDSLFIYKSALSESEQTWKSSRKMKKLERVLENGLTFDPAGWNREDKRKNVHFACDCRCKSNNKFGCSMSPNVG